jgi:hypothetical protein
VAGSGAAFGKADVMSAAGMIEHGALPLAAAGRHRLAVPVHVKRAARDLELRVISNGSGQVTLHGITLQSAK